LSFARNFWMDITICMAVLSQWRHQLCFSQRSSHVFAMLLTDAVRQSQIIHESLSDLQEYIHNAPYLSSWTEIISTIFKLDLIFLHSFSLLGMILTSITKTASLFWYHISRSMPHLT
jgi:hypothetical protein